MRSAIIIAGVLTVLVVPVAAGTTAGMISGSSIAGAKLGGTKADYAKLLGAGTEEEILRRNPAFFRLGSGTRRAVYFKRKTGKAILITTWSRTDRTAAGVGPCSPIATVKKVYGDRLKPSKTETYSDGPHAYRLGNVIFGAYHASKHVTAVGVFTDVTEATATDFTLALDQATC